MIYLLFVVSIAASIAYTEYTVFHTLVFNQYVIGKILLESLQNTLLALITAKAFLFTLSYLHINRKYDVHSKEEEKDLINNDTFATILVIVLFAVTLLPLRTIVATSYIGGDGVFLRLAFVHFDTNVKIFVSLILIGVAMTYLVIKYRPNTRNIIIVFCILALAPTSNIIATRYKSFDVTEAQLRQMYNRSIGDGQIVDTEQGEKMRPLAERLMRTARTDSERATANSWMVDTEISLGNFEKALEYNEKALEIHEYSATSYIDKSYVYRAMGDPEKALVAARRCLTIAEEKQNTDNQARCESEIALNYTSLGTDIHEYKNKDDLVQAKAHIDKAIALDPEQLFFRGKQREIQVYLATVETEAGNYAKAISQFDEILAENERTQGYRHEFISSLTLSRRGLAKIKSTDFSGAIKDLEKSLEMFPDDDKTALFNIAGAYTDLGDMEKAIEFYEKSLLLDPESKRSAVTNKDILLREISIYQYLDNLGKLERAYTRLLEIDPNNGSIYGERGFYIYGNTGEYEKALNDYKRSVTLDPGGEFYKFMKADTESRLNRKEEMCRTLKTINVSAILEYKESYYSLNEGC